MISKLIVDIERGRSTAAYEVVLKYKHPTTGNLIKIYTMFVNITNTSCGIYSINCVQEGMERLFDVFGEKQVLRDTKKIFIKIIKKLAQRKYHRRLPAFVYVSVITDRKYRHSYTDQSNRRMEIIAKTIESISIASAPPRVNPNSGNTISFNILEIEDLFKKK